MKTNLTFQIYAITVSTTVAVLNNFTKYDIFWLVFTIGGIFIMIGHSVFDQKVKHSLGKIIWMVLTSFIVCLFIKFLYDEKIITLMSMIVSTLIASMVAPATFSIVLKELPEKIAEQIASIPEWLLNLLKSRVDKNNDNN